ncbi:MAG TPA: hypothetical protein PLB45_00490 [Bacilli bacterium]|jgi:hypothetical protein|nr:hypothetical protein [Bacilli bacterium]HQC83338.1 hypothetical protein [Bacilli bacterium]
MKNKKEVLIPYKTSLIETAKMIKKATSEGKDSKIIFDDLENSIFERLEVLVYKPRIYSLKEFISNYISIADNLPSIMLGIEIMEDLANEDNWDNAIAKYEASYKQKLDTSLIRSLIINFSKTGPDFIQFVEPILLPDEEKQLKEIRTLNNYLEHNKTNERK